MASGTISVENGSSDVVGMDTAFTSELSVGDYILFTIGGTLYTYPILTITSDTALTFADDFDGPTTASVSFNSVPQNQMVSIPMDLVYQTTRAIRGLNLDKDNWQQVFSVDDDITVTLPDGTQYSGVSWLEASKGIDLTNLDTINAIADQVNSDATTASDAATAASTSETNAATSASNAATSEQNASNSATAADQSATDAQASADSIGDAVAQAAASASAASDSASAAATSESNAADSASAASTSETNAATSEANALTSENNAATSESNASRSADEAAQSASDASDSAAAAATSETNASNSAEGIQDAMTNAAQSASDASDSADRAEAAAADLENNNALAATIDHVDSDTNDVYFKGSLIAGENATEPQSFNSIYSDSELGSTGDVAQGGDLTSTYQVNQTDISAISLHSTFNDGLTAGGEIVLVDSSGSEDVTTSWVLPNLAGTLITSEGLNIDTVNGNDVTFEGALGVGRDASADNELVTLRQLRAAVAGGSSDGSTLNGVMNNFVGAVEWFVGTRAALPAAHLAADGQLLNRADYPDLWEAISSDIFQSIDDDTWQGTRTSRGSYSTGDGSTTFRMPDLNGLFVHPTDSTLNAIEGLFLRGDGGSEGGGVGTIRPSAAPNITGSFQLHAEGAANIIAGYTGFCVGAEGDTSNYRTPADLTTHASVRSYGTMRFDASNSNSAYGNTSTTEVRPNSVKGIWLIRVSGVFESASTVFNVINADEDEPGSGAVVYGGSVTSEYDVAGAIETTSTFRARTTFGTTTARSSIIESSDGTNTNVLAINSGASGSGGVGTDIIAESGELGLYSRGGAVIRALDDGSVRFQDSAGVGRMHLYNVGIDIAGRINSADVIISSNLATESTGNVSNNALIMTAADTNYNCYLGYYLVAGEYHSWRTIMNGTTTFQVRGGAQGCYAASFNQTSDSRLKFNKKFIENSLEKTVGMRGMTYDKNGHDSAGVIAQDIVKEFPQSCTEVPQPIQFSDGSVLESYLALDYGCITALHTESIKEMLLMIKDIFDDPNGAGRDKLNDLCSKINTSLDDEMINKGDTSYHDLQPEETS
ncbi:hypothetical protein F3J37_01015 [Pantoea sp. Al-1710]|uniref:Peptidase S74 domain-containing protein n=1 Tax=Candidatus Pantoea communis TaxID=2608354 RepID=A0ABX0RI10_9GAMM|nr:MULTISPECIES: tail fiber domain-containing protein [Pantoea]NIG13043.1 hypothetical protein [Pantoea sp. Cy-640]NIG17256.1 hypothetical protein [Pantoea communis]